MDTSLSTLEISEIAKEAYLYGWPMSENYNTMYAYSIDDSESNPNFQAPINQIHNNSEVYGPEDTAVVTPNSDTPYSSLWADIRTEPIVITVPPMDGDRYYSFQLIDLYTYNFDYIGTRTNFEQGGNFLIAGPGWDGTKPLGITAVFRCDTEYFFSLTRTQLYSPEDQSNVEAIQAQYEVQTLSQFLGTPSLPPAPVENWPAPCSGEAAKTPAVFENINFLLQFCPTLDGEQELMARFAQIGVGAGIEFDASSLTPEMEAAYQAGINAAWKEFDGVNEQVSAGELSTSDFFGNREYLGNNYLYRFAGAALGLYGNSKEEANYQMYQVDADGDALDASQHVYTFTIDETLPYKAFASITMYDKDSQLLVANPIARYLINTPMLDQLIRNEDGSITLYLQTASPGLDLEPNWLPTPDTTFYAVLRLYVPEQIVIDGTWVRPEIQKV